MGSKLSRRELLTSAGLVSLGDGKSMEGQRVNPAHARYAAVETLLPGDTLFLPAWRLPDGPDGMEVLLAERPSREVVVLTVWRQTGIHRLDLPVGTQVRVVPGRR